MGGLQKSENTGKIIINSQKTNSLKMERIIKTLYLTFKLLITTVSKSLIEYVDVLVHEIFDVERGQLKHIPNFIIFLIYALCLSVLFQGALDFVIEVLMLGGFIEKIPIRIDFIFLTIISVVMGIQTLKGLAHRKFDVTRNSILIGIVVELALIVGDLTLIVQRSDEIGVLPLIRMPFLMLTFLNLGILIYVAKYLKVFRGRHGAWEIF